MRWLFLASLLATASPTLAQEPWLDIGFYLIEVEGEASRINRLMVDGERMEADGGYPERLDREVPPEEFEQLKSLIGQRLELFGFTTSEPMETPYVAVILSFDGNDRYIEIEEQYERGRLPEVYLEFQEHYFEDVIR